MVSPFESLPIEVQEKVFKHLEYNTPTILNSMCVCKNWYHLFQKLLYTSVWLKDDLQMDQFAETIMKNQYLKIHVKDLNFDFSEGYRHLRHTFAFLFAELFNVERISFHGQLFFSFLLKALLLNQLLNLTHIEPIEYPAYYYHSGIYKREVRAYAKCVILLKDQLRNLTIVESDDNVVEDADDASDESVDDELISASGFSLIENLNQFRNLRELHIEKKCENIIELIEKVTLDCPSLQLFDLKIVPTHSHTTNLATMMPYYTPANDINYLKFFGPLFKNIQLVNYIMDKFPQLKTLDARNDGRSNFSTTYLDNHTLIKLLNYLSKIKSVKFPSIPCNEETINNAILPFWSTINETHLLSVRFLSVKDEKKIMDIRPSDGVFTSNFYLSPSIAGLRFITVLEKFGCYTNHLTLTDIDADKLDLLQQPNNTPFKFLVLQPLKYCNRLKQVSIINSTLTGADVKGYEIYKRQTFDTLKFVSCIIEENAFFERLSQLFDSIKTFEVSGIRLVEYPADIRLAYANINMADTMIGKLILGEYRGNDEDVLVVKLSIDQNQSYYKYDINNHGDGTKTYKDFIPITEKDYDNELSTGKCVLIGITCKALQALDVQYGSKCLQLSLT